MKCWKCEFEFGESKAQVEPYFYDVISAMVAEDEYSIDYIEKYRFKCPKCGSLKETSNTFGLNK